MKKKLLLLFFAVSALQLFGQGQTTFLNPVIRGDIADPSILRIEDTYYATGTSSEWAPFYPVFSSKDLVNWTQTGHIFNKKPAWTSNSFWAPELYYHNNKIYCYYTARKKSNGISYIGVATSDSPLHEFTDHGPVVEYGSEAIDAFIYNDNGQLYISWKAYGLDDRPIELLGSKLSADGLKLEGEPFSLLVDNERIGMEGQYHFKQGDYYYIIYSAHGCCGPSSDYDVYVARSKNFKGPYEKYTDNPILKGGDGDFLSCGHGTAVTTPDGRMFYLCHAYMKDAGFYAGRQPILQEIFVGDDGWVHVKTGNVATIKQPTPFEGTIQNAVTGFEDSFQDNKLKVDWTWNYPYSDVKTTIKNGKLLLTGKMLNKDSHGTALCLRPQSPDYSYETEVTNHNSSLKGLTLYGDDKSFIVWGVTDNQLQLRSVKDGKETVLYESTYDSPSLFLKIKVEKGRRLSFYRSKDGQEWTEPIDTDCDTEHLIRWDRVSRPGLMHLGKSKDPAEFSYFKLK